MTTRWQGWASELFIIWKKYARYMFNHTQGRASSNKKYVFWTPENINQIILIKKSRILFKKMKFKSWKSRKKNPMRGANHNFSRKNLRNRENLRKKICDFCIKKYREENCMCHVTIFTLKNYDFFINSFFLDFISTTNKITIFFCTIFFTIFITLFLCGTIFTKKIVKKKKHIQLFRPFFS
jgi:hypothetical protein